MAYRSYEIDSLINSIRAFSIRARECSHDGCTQICNDTWCPMHKDINLRLYLELIKDNATGVNT